MSRMAWTLPTALFFGGIAVLLAGMTLVELRWPCVERKGFLPITTTRGIGCSSVCSAAPTCTCW